MSMQTRAFRPLALTQNIAVTTVAQTVMLNYLPGSTSIRLCNVGTQNVFISFDGTDASLTTSLILPAGQTEAFTIPVGVISYSVIAPAVGSTIYSTVGEGL